jgi:hypothetical protein
MATAVICLDCGWKGQMLRRHVATAHGLTVDLYRARWNLSRDHALVGPSPNLISVGFLHLLNVGFLRNGKRASGACVGRRHCGSAEVIATTSSAAKAERLRALGAAAVIDYLETPEWHEKVAELTGGRGVDCVIEIGGPDTLANSIKSLAVGGHISLIGSSLSRSGIMLDPLLLGGRGMSLGSISVGSRADFEAMNRAIALHRLRPVIDRVFPFDAARDAYRYFESRAHFGKVVINHG